jgi:toxin FitB
VSFLLDTCVVSELVRTSPQSSVLAWLEDQDETSLYLSVITMGEIEKGIARLPASARKGRLQSWVRRDLAARFGARLLALDVRVASRWGALTGESEKRGTPLPVIDSMIAATALVHGLTVVTRNTDDFERCGAPCLNPWNPLS